MSRAAQQNKQNELQRIVAEATSEPADWLANARAPRTRTYALTNTHGHATRACAQVWSSGAERTLPEEGVLLILTKRTWPCCVRSSVHVQRKYAAHVYYSIVYIPDYTHLLTHSWSPFSRTKTRSAHRNARTSRARVHTSQCACNCCTLVQTHALVRSSSSSSGRQTFEANAGAHMHTSIHNIYARVPAVCGAPVDTKRS